jgi:hypothetical protein
VGFAGDGVQAYGGCRNYGHWLSEGQIRDEQSAAEWAQLLQGKQLPLQALQPALTGRLEACSVSKSYKSFIDDEAPAKRLRLKLKECTMHAHLSAPVTFERPTSVIRQCPPPLTAITTVNLASVELHVRAVS